MAKEIPYIDKALFLIITWIPIVLFIAGLACTIAAIILYRKNKPYKKFKIIAIVCLALIVNYFIIFLIMGIIGIGAGLSDMVTESPKSASSIAFKQRATFIASTYIPIVSFIIGLASAICAIVLARQKKPYKKSKTTALVCLSIIVVYILVILILQMVGVIPNLSVLLY